ncbi:MAG: L,D-transpeptidase [Chromatiales bacterium]|nr:L,D-transpeptidase [Chromatiales bacterium]
MALKRVLPLLLLLYSPAYGSVGVNDTANSAKTYELTTIAVVRSAPDGEIIDVWSDGVLFTSNEGEGDWLRVTGHFPDGDRWEEHTISAWINRHYAAPFEYTRKSKRADNVIRYIEVDKSDFELRVVEQRSEGREVLLKTTVALGMDRCLPKSKGGKCYYTEPGEYHVRWKVYDPDGIEWCIPKSMEKEYVEDIAAGNRCFRGPLGKHALNIGKTYAIHGTPKTETLGTKASHGCVRTANQQMAQIYKMVDEGDKVYIVD